MKRFRTVFRSTLLNSLPPERQFEHKIDTGDATSINLNAYPLSQVQLKEQVKQVSSLLKKGLIKESSSS